MTKSPSLLVLFAVGIAAAGCSGHDAVRSELDRAAASRETRYVDPLGFSLAYPHSLHLERSQAELRIFVSEVTVANFPLRKAVRSGSTPNGGWLRVDPPRDRRNAFPADGIAFRILYGEGGPAPALELPESHFPLRLKSFRRSSEYLHTSPRPLERTVVANGRNFRAQVWLGAKASRPERAVLRGVISSLSFPRLRVGQTVGYGFRVLERAARYDVGSFARIRVADQPFYLVHAPGGFYALGWRWQSIAGGYKPYCKLRLDSGRKQFFCTNLAARWDPVGRVLIKPAGSWPNDPLNVAVAKVSSDGHVLLYPGTARFADESYARQLWPGWELGGANRSCGSRVASPDCELAPVG